MAEGCASVGSSWIQVPDEGVTTHPSVLERFDRGADQLLEGLDTRAVCQIVTPTQVGIGFLLCAGHLITANSVLPDRELAAGSRARFFFEDRPREVELNPDTFFERGDGSCSYTVVGCDVDLPPIGITDWAWCIPTPALSLRPGERPTCTGLDVRPTRAFVTADLEGELNGPGAPLLAIRDGSARLFGMQSGEACVHMDAIVADLLRKQPDALGLTPDHGILLRGSRYLDCEELLQRVEGSNCPFSWNERGLVHLRAGQFDEAYSQFSKAGLLGCVAARYNVYRCHKERWGVKETPDPDHWKRFWRLDDDAEARDFIRVRGKKVAQTSDTAPCGCARSEIGGD